VSGGTRTRGQVALEGADLSFVRGCCPCSKGARNAATADVLDGGGCLLLDGGLDVLHAGHSRGASAPLLDVELVVDIDEIDESASLLDIVFV